MSGAQQAADFGMRLSLDRIRFWCLGLGAMGAGISYAEFGGGIAATFAVGTLASFFNFQLLHAVVQHIGPEPVPGRRRVLWLFVFRYGVLGLLGYATVRVFGVNPAPFCLGLTVAAFAALLDSISELIYARA